MKECKNVYIIGAGFNQCVTGSGGLNPPLSRNFFSTILKSSIYLEKNYIEKFNSVFKYINKYWKMDMKDLKNDRLDVEECFTFLQLQIKDALENKDDKSIYELSKINTLLKIMFIEFLYGFQEYIEFSSVMKEFGQFVYKGNETIITFNYDCNLEKAIQCSTGLCVETPKVYDISFDEVNTQQLKECVELKKDFKILKMHGSINWFKKIYKESNFETYKESREKIVLSSDEWWRKYLNYSREKYLVDPVIIPPVLYKNYNQKPIKHIWCKAKEKLTQCRNLVIIGYSLPFTDFACKKLLLESFQNNNLQKLILVNPNASLLMDFKKATHYNRPITVCSNLEEFIENKEKILSEL